MTRSTYGRLHSVQHRQACNIWRSRFDEPPLEEPCFTVAQLDRTVQDVSDVRRLLNAVLDECMPARCAEILVARTDGLTLDEIGHTLGITRERVRQLERVAIAKARQALRAHGIRCTADAI